MASALTPSSSQSVRQRELPADLRSPLPPSTHATCTHCHMSLHWPQTRATADAAAVSAAAVVTAYAVTLRSNRIGVVRQSLRLPSMTLLGWCDEKCISFHLSFLSSNPPLLSVSLLSSREESRKVINGARKAGNNSVCRIRVQHSSSNGGGGLLDVHVHSHSLPVHYQGQQRQRMRGKKGKQAYKPIPCRTPNSLAPCASLFAFHKRPESESERRGERR